MRTQKRPKYVNEIIDSVNRELRFRKVKDFNESELCCWIDNYLLDKKMYRGYNFYREMENGKLTLAGTADPEKYDCIQIY